MLGRRREVSLLQRNCSTSVEKQAARLRKQLSIVEHLRLECRPRTNVAQQTEHPSMLPFFHFISGPELHSVAPADSQSGPWPQIPLLHVALAA